jgi:hypothetical protein
MDMQMEYLASRPEFFGLAGIEWYVSHHAYEDYIRWAALLCRHYGIEGHDRRLGHDPYNVSHLRNGGFAAGTEAWQVTPAEPDSVAVRNCPGYGLLQERKPYWAFTDTSVLCLRRSAARPNQIAQVLTGLEPGRLYTLRLAVADYQDFIEGKSAAADRVLRIEIDGAEPVEDWYRTASFKDSAQQYRTWRSAGPFDGKNTLAISLPQRVFRAKGRTATLRLSDWASATAPGGPVGQELMLNYVQVRPYLEP